MISPEKLKHIDYREFSHNLDKETGMKLFFAELQFGEDEVVDGCITVGVFTDEEKAKRSASKHRSGNIIYGDWVVGVVVPCFTKEEAVSYLKGRVVSWSLCKQAYHLGLGALLVEQIASTHGVCSKLP